MPAFMEEGMSKPVSLHQSGQSDTKSLYGKLSLGVEIFITLVGIFGVIQVSKML